MEGGGEGRTIFDMQLDVIALKNTNYSVDAINKSSSSSCLIITFYLKQIFFPILFLFIHCRHC